MQKFFLNTLKWVLQVLWIKKQQQTKRISENIAEASFPPSG